MASHPKVPVTALHQATDPERFRPEPGGPTHELLFIANSRNVKRRIINNYLRSPWYHDLAIYGRGWSSDVVDPRFVKGESVPNAELVPLAYSDGGDGPQRPLGRHAGRRGSSRTGYTTRSTCGAFVISDEAGIEAEFDGAVTDLPRSRGTRAAHRPIPRGPGRAQRLAAQGAHRPRAAHVDLRAEALGTVVAPAAPAVATDHRIGGRCAAGSPGQPPPGPRS